MTKVLVISNKSDLTSDFVIKRIKERKIDFYRFNTEELTKTCSVSLDFSTDLFSITDLITKRKFDLKEFNAVYFRRPEIPSINSSDLNKGETIFLKNEITYTLEGIYKILRNAYWVSPIYAIREAENKIYQLELAKSIGFKIPNSIITNSFEDFKCFYEKEKGACIIKPIKSGLIENESKSKVVFTSILENEPTSKKQLEISPNFLQTHIHKKGDIRVTMVGKNAFATLIHSQENPQTQIDWRRGENILKYTKIELPTKELNSCIKLLSILNLRFGAIDFILDEDDNFIFLEINPNGQWAWIEKQTGYEISDEIVNLLEYENF
ncbi:MAG: hypothetical protein HXX16_01430 [Bacteroidales bacterium]|nr:hypothetical protein [Bacteroidales bacterium]